MGRFRHRWIRLLALFGVMLHAYAIAGSQSRAMAMAIAQSSAPPGHVVICRADGSIQIIAVQDLLLGESAPSAKAQHCPVCSAAPPAFTVDVPALIAPERLTAITDVRPLIENASLPVARAARPPATGPPAIV